MATAQAEVLPIVLEAQDNTGSAWASLKRRASEGKQAVDLLKSSFESFGSGNATSSLAGAGNAVRLLANPFVALAAVVAGVGVAAVLTHNQLSRIGTAADDIGVGARAIDGLQIALSKVGAESGTAAAALASLKTEAAKAQRDGGYLEDLFKLNGSSIYGAKGELKDIGTLYQEINGFIRSARNETERLEIATAVYGESGKLMAEVIRNGGDSLGALADKADGALDPAVKQAQEFDRLWKEVTRSGDGLATNLRNMVLPLLTDATRLVLQIAAYAGSGSAQQSVYLQKNVNAYRLLDNQSQIDAFYGAVMGGRNATVTPNNRAKETSDQFDRAISSVAKHIAIMEADARAVGATAGEHERLRVQAQLLDAAQRAGIDVSGERARQFTELAERARAAADALAAATLRNDLMFERAQMGRSASEQDVWSRLRGAGIDPASAQGEMLAQQIRLNDSLRETQDISKDALKGFLSDLRQGKSAAEALDNVLSRVIDRLSNKAIDNLVNGLTGSAGGFGIGNLFGGGSSGQLTGTDLALNQALFPGYGTGHSGAVIGRWSTGTKHVHPAHFDDARRYHGGGRLGPKEVPFIGLEGEEVGFPEQLRAKYGSKANVNVGVKVINNHSGADVSVGEARPNGNGGFDIEVMIDQLTAKNMARPGTASSKVLASSGVRTPLARR